MILLFIMTIIWSALVGELALIWHYTRCIHKSHYASQLSIQRTALTHAAMQWARLRLADDPHLMATLQKRGHLVITHTIPWDSSTQNTFSSTYTHMKKSNQINITVAGPKITTRTFSY